MNLNKQHIQNMPIPERVVHKTQFGNVDSTRGDNTMDPPIELEDHYHWMRDGALSMYVYMSLYSFKYADI